MHKVFYRNGEMRPVVNQKSLNNYLRKKTFQDGNTGKVLNIVEVGDWAVTIDLKDAYRPIMMHKSHRQFLRFCSKG